MPEERISIREEAIINQISNEEAPTPFDPIRLRGRLRGRTAGITIEPLENFSISEKTIGEELDENSEVRLRNGKVALVKDSILLEGYWYLKKDPEVIKDDHTGEFIHRGSSVKYLKSIVDNKVIFGLTHYDNVDAVPRLNSKKYGVFDTLVLDIDMLENGPFVENMRLGHYQDSDTPLLSSDTNIQNIMDYHQFPNPSSGRSLSLSDQFKLGIKSPSFVISEGIKYTFGIELEVNRGYIPHWKAKHNNFNISCVRDGSINSGEGGPEYVTGVLTGDTGFKHLQEICLELSKRTKVNYTCGVHIHLGNINFTNQFLVNSYILCLLLENQIFELLPKSRRNNRYCRRLKKLDLKVALDNSRDNLELQESYNKLFKYISVDRSFYPNKETNKLKQHPMGAKCHYDQSTPRYCWINYVPAMFNTRNNIKGYSLELRNHSGTTNFNKIKNWTLLFMAICSFAERYPEKILPGITINEILSIIYPKKCKSLIVYFNLRRELFKDLDNETADETEVKKSIKELIKN